MYQPPAPAAGPPSRSQRRARAAAVHRCRSAVRRADASPRCLHTQKHQGLTQCLSIGWATAAGSDVCSGQPCMPPSHPGEGARTALGVLCVLSVRDVLRGPVWMGLSNAGDRPACSATLQEKEEREEQENREDREAQYTVAGTVRRERRKAHPMPGRRRAINRPSRQGSAALMILGRQIPGLPTYFSRCRRSTSPQRRLPAAAATRTSRAQPTSPLC